ncbi:MAG: S8 family serine peptidase, partial [Candidatus Hodarchaeales archaeon]
MAARRSSDKQLKLLYYVLAALPIPILLLSAVILVPNQISPPPRDDDPLVWPLGNGWQLRLELHKYVEEVSPELPSSAPALGGTETSGGSSEGSSSESYIITSSVWTDMEPDIDNHVSFGEWPLDLETILVGVTEFEGIEFGSQNNERFLFLLFIFHWNEQYPDITRIEARIEFKVYHLAYDDKLVIRFHLEKTAESFNTAHANIQLHMQKAPIGIEIPDEDRLGQIDIETFREQLYARIDRNRNDVHDDLDSKISSGTITDWVRTIITCKRGSLPEIRAYLEESGGQVFEVWEPLEGFYGLAANVSAEKISVFGQHSDIEMIEESAPTLRFADDATRLTQLRTHVWDTLEYTGANNNSIAIVDTGLDDNHPILNGYGNKAFGNSGYKIVGWYDATGDGAGSPEDYQGHGSHCGGIAAGLPYNATVSLSDSRIKTTWSY